MGGGAGLGISKIQNTKRKSWRAVYVSYCATQTYQGKHDTHDGKPHTVGDHRGMRAWPRPGGAENPGRSWLPSFTMIVLDEMMRGQIWGT